MIALVDSPYIASWQDDFSAMLPRLQRYARRAFRHLRGDAKDDAVSEVIASCLCAYHRLVERDEVHRAFASVLMRYAICLYYRGKRVGTRQSSRDVYANHRRPNRSFELQSIGSPREQRSAWMECLTDNATTPIPDQAHFRIEFPRWLQTRTSRDRQIITALSEGHSTSDVADRFQISPGRVSQLRRKYCESWNEFNGGAVPACA